MDRERIINSMIVAEVLGERKLAAVRSESRILAKMMLDRFCMYLNDSETADIQCGLVFVRFLQVIDNEDDKDYVIKNVLEGSKKDLFLSLLLENQFNTPTDFYDDLEVDLINYFNDASK